MKNPVLLLVLFVSFEVLSACAAAEFRAGVGRAVITPQESIWMAGYASRTAPSDGKIHDLFAKAVAFEDEAGGRSVLVTTDLLGLPRWLVQRVAETARQRFQLPRERLMVTFSHTHCGPVLGGDRLADMYGLDDEQMRKVDAYTGELPGKLIGVIEAALQDLEPCRVQWGVGRATFAMNRREYTLTGVVIGANPIGPVDHDVPVLKIARPDGTIKAVVHGYACHNTTLAFQKICGDYAGFSQAYLEEKMPGTSALFVSGCGADANPHPRRTLELARQYGEELGVAVLGALRQPLVEVRGPIAARFKEIPLALSPAPSRAELERQLAEGSIYVQRRARRLLRVLDENGSLPTHYPYAVQWWQFGDSLKVAALAGEVVADYSLRLKREFGGGATWVIGYANDFVAYIPSLRILREGGYEGGDSMVYFGHHGPWAPTIEQDILEAVRELSGRR